MRVPRPVNLKVLVVLSLVAVAGCGSTVPLSQMNAGGATGSGLSVPNGSSGSAGSLGSGAGTTGGGSGFAAGAGTAGTGSTASGGAAGGGASTGAGSTATGGKSAAARSSAGGAVPASGPGWTPSTVYIGVTTQKDAQQAFQSVGVKGLDTGDQTAEAQAAADAVNRSGGIFGRKIQLVFRDVSTVQAAEDPATTGQSVCTYFTQDHRVLALISPVTLIDYPAFRSCMAKAHVPLFSATVNAYDSSLGRTLAPDWYQLLSPNWDELAPVLARSLKAQGWFGGWNPRLGAPAPNSRAKVGIFYTDDSVGTHVRDLIAGALAQQGYPNPVTYGYTQGSTNSFQPAVAAFEQKGVTHVIVPNSDLLPFQLNASSQQYKPRYAVTSYSTPAIELETNSPAGQNNGALGVGWSPSLDVDDANDHVTTPGEKQCLAIEKRGGQTFAGKRLAEAVAFAFCDGIRLVAAGAKAGGGLTGDVIYRGVESLGSHFAPASSFANALGQGRVYVPGAARNLAYVASCKCFRYTSGGTQPL